MKKKKIEKKVDMEIDGKKIKKIELADTFWVDQYSELAADFFPAILKMEVKDVLITDESSLWDFTSFCNDKEDLDIYIKRVKKHYGVDISDMKDFNLVKIFKRINVLRD